MHSTDRAYRVEVRATGAPVIFADIAIGNEWRRLPETHGPGPGDAYNRERDVLTSTHDYYGALALACSALSRMGSLFHKLDVRLIEYERKVDWSLTEKEVLPLPDAIDDMFARAGAAKRAEEAQCK